MKKIIYFGLVLLILLGCLTGCSFTQNMSGAIAGEAEATPKAEEMMAALADRNISDAKALLHPTVSEAYEEEITQMIDYLAGRKASDLEVKSININNTTGTTGKERQEQVTYKVTLTDGEQIFVYVAYVSNNAGAGFVAFQVVLGVG